MQEVFEKIKERIGEKSMVNIMDYPDVLNGDYVMYKYVMEAIDEVAEEFAPDINVGDSGWISCSKMLPVEPKANPVFDCKPLELYLVDCGAEYPLRAFWNGKFFTDGFSKLDVIAWRPLPEPYKEQNDD